MGIVCIVFSMIFACLGFFFGDLGKVDTTVSTVLIQFLTAGIALFGVTVLDKSINNKDKDKDRHYPGNYEGGKEE